MPSFRACWRSAPTVRFICFEIFETGVLAFECFRSSACITFVHAAPLRMIFFFVALAFYPSNLCGVLSRINKSMLAEEVPLAREQRKLAAILAAAVVGYSPLMGRDESGTLAALARTVALVAVSASCKLQA
jgi:hypothetical protein